MRLHFHFRQNTLLLLTDKWRSGTTSFIKYLGRYFMCFQLSPAQVDNIWAAERKGDQKAHSL